MVGRYVRLLLRRGHQTVWLVEALAQAPSTAETVSIQPADAARAIHGTAPKPSKIARASSSASESLVDSPSSSSASASQ